MNKSLFTISGTPLAGLQIVQRSLHKDTRGYFCRFFCAEELHTAGIKKPIAQINHTLTYKAGTVRGLHYQHPPHGEVKLVSCLKGEIFDIAVDLRHNSPTFLHWHGEVLSEANFKSLLIPEGFAHGYQTLTDDCALIYLHTESYHPEAEGAFNIADPRLAIKWPLEIMGMSDRDRQHPFITQNYQGILL
jgi:dTDP-4-dehydrorhamnose 3,5-epimerase